MSVYHSIRSSVQQSSVVNEVEDQDGLVLVDLTADSDIESTNGIIHPASERVSGQVSIITTIK